MSLLTTVKGLPTGYSSDLQETKTRLWESVDDVKGSLEILSGVIATLKVDEKRVTESLSGSYAFAVDLAEHLAGKSGLSFREAHMIVGNLVREMSSSQLILKDLKGEAIEATAEKILGKKVAVEEDLIRSLADSNTVLSGRKSAGAPSPNEEKRMLKTRIETLRDCKTRLGATTKKLEQAKNKLKETVEGYI